MTNQIPLPDWVQWSKEKGHYVLLQPCICLRCKGDPWYPRINHDGTMKLNICPHCKTPYWNKPKNTGVQS